MYRNKSKLSKIQWIGQYINDNFIPIEYEGWWQGRMAVMYCFQVICALLICVFQLWSYMAIVS